MDFSGMLDRRGSSVETRGRLGGDCDHPGGETGLSSNPVESHLCP